MSPQKLSEAIAAGCRHLPLQLDDAQLQQLSQLLTELERWNARTNLTAIRNINDMVSGHILDSLAVEPYLRGERIIDIGTGPGFPGLPLAISNPARQFTLLDSNGKKISFVQHMITLLGLNNVQAVKARAEDYAPEHSFDTVIARALATIPKIIELGGHLVAESGIVLALKGKYPAAELEQLNHAGDEWQVAIEKIDVPTLSEHSRHIVSLERRAE